MKIRKILRWTRFIPLVVYAHVNLLLAGVFGAGALPYDTVKYYTGLYNQWVTGSSNYGWRAADFYTCAFEYPESTLVAFIFMVINANLISVAVVSGIIQLVLKNQRKGNVLFNIIFSAIYFTTGLVMSFFLAACCHIDDGVFMIVLAFLSTFLVLVAGAYGILSMILTSIANKKEAQNAGQPKAEEKPQVASSNQWKCPICGALNEEDFCGECGAKKPGTQKEVHNIWFCPECGAKNDGDFCGECGTKKPEF